MANEPEDNKDEYKLSDEHRLDVYPVKSPGIGGVLSGLIARNRGIITIIGIIIVVYIFWRVITAIGHDKVAQVKKPSIASQNVPVKTVAPRPMLTQTLAPATSVVMPSQTIMPPTAMSSNNLNQMQQMQTTIAGIDQRMYSVQQTLANLSFSLRRLENIVAQQLYLQQQKQAAHLNMIRKNAQDMYHVQAVIPNRAWLLGPHNQVLTVNVGSFIPSVGTVTAIDSDSGLVMTNTGATLHFALDEQ